MEQGHGSLAQHGTALLALMLVLVRAPGVPAYGFRNCLQALDDPGHFRCIQRFLSNMAGAVGDLPANTTVLEVAHNTIACLLPGAFTHLPALRSLHLPFNQLCDLAPGAFVGLQALQSLNLSHNQLQTLPTGAFTGLPNLTELVLNTNPLRTLPVDAFGPLPNLRHLLLCSCHLCDFGAIAQSLQGLTALQELSLCGNRLRALGPSPGLPPSLAVLRLCNNSLVAVDGGGRALLAGVRDLDLSYNNLSDADSFARVSLAHLNILRLAGNQLDPFQLLAVSNVPNRSLDFSGLPLGAKGVHGVCRCLGPAPLTQLLLQHLELHVLHNGSLAACPPMRALDLSGNRLRALGCVGEFLSAPQRAVLENLTAEHNLLAGLGSCLQAMRLPMLRELNLSYNRVLSVGRGAFAFAPNLRALRLNINTVAFLHRQALGTLPGLTELRLDNNLLTDLYIESFAGLPRLETLNLRNNRVAVLFPGVFKHLGRLRTLDLGGNILRRLTPAAFHGLGSLARLYLDGNHIAYISADIFQPVQTTLEVLDLKGNRLQYITAQLAHEPPFLYLNRLTDLKLQAQQPYGLKLIPHHFFRGLTALQALYLAQNKLLSVPPDAFDDLAQLRYLTLADSSNGMWDLPPGVFKNLSRLRVLDLENAGVHTLSLEVLGNLTQLEELRLAKNELRTFNGSVARALRTLHYLDLRKCPLSCACADAWLWPWLNSSHAQVVYLYNLTCARRGPPTYLHGFSTTVCFLDVGLYLFAATAPALLLFMALPVLYLRAYWRLRYHWFLLRSWVNERWQRADEGHYRYDAFVSYNSADEAWVLQDLVPQLEGAGLCLCLHHRDFRLGRSIVDNIVDGIYSSRKTVCVLSRRYLRSEWCSLEIQLASYRLFDELRDVLVLVLLEDVPERELSAYHRMRKVMLRKTYIHWPPEPAAQSLFWAQLCCAVRGSHADGKDEELCCFDDPGTVGPGPGS
ncbi:Toll-like receptor 21 precursor isoform A [Alligator mississippiensis]|uniref:Toll-like receptor 21 isoform A n=2 Tax=Alligator mississippiensis TaxID=8496 RepID=A0A151NWA5_ALLMI|nr:Toll-like receptor 21 precursor isoform A [Alligator mississippiensis]